MTLGRNAKRTRERHARNFGAEADAVRGLRCLCNDQLCDELVASGNSDTEDIESRWCAGGIEPAHVASRGASGGRFDVVPLCKNHHAEQHQHGVKTFAAKYGLDLRAEADRVALGHERPLGIRGLADRWTWWHSIVDLAAEYTSAPEVLDTYETDALRGWLRRRMDNAARTAAPFLDVQKAVWILDVATALGLSLVDAEKICEWAGWPS
jgi:hypothetical protein